MQYMLFAGNHYYPKGGINDLQKTFLAGDSRHAKQIALEYASTEGASYEWFHLILIEVDGSISFLQISYWDQVPDWMDGEYVSD